ncbi:hypothetical protein Q361_101184 [Flavobacterium croceum DSM 17960]|uniref:DUF5017 domain-containing protein n=1 Tax=Flavobacterium croceum DSM 17960 TaxID=1121886 RepID=A0A2S4NBS4_9FLAO|nr:choice-of-anchor J domain-containing protein [Flavobacterium croceum]POS03080.1 hypothetical protein Q361_101184 [Flavobacterium croceum DSM 17960]
MKKIKLIIAMSGLTLLGFTSCSPEEDIKNPDFNPLIFGEDFSKSTEDGTALIAPGWINYSEAGTLLWKQGYHKVTPSNIYQGYAVFNSYQSGQASNIGWLISPKIDLDAQEGEVLRFECAQAYVSSAANSIEVLISNNFDGTNVLGATWTPLDCTLPTTSSAYFYFTDSGEINLSSYTGKVNIAFRVKGSGTNTSLDGTYQVDNIRVYKK